jgi:hypothetical protein
VGRHGCLTFYAPIFRALILAPSRSRMSAIIAANSRSRILISHWQFDNVRFGSKADIRAAKSHVCFTPQSGHVRCSKKNRHPISSSARASQRWRSSLPMHVPKHQWLHGRDIRLPDLWRKLHSASGAGKCTTPAWCVILIYPALNTQLLFVCRLFSRRTRHETCRPPW